MTVGVGMIPPAGGSPASQAEALAAMADAGLDHVVVGDHVSFFGGFGIDGLVHAAALSMLHPTLPVHTCVYLLALRHPVLVARQLSTIASLAPGRLVLGVGIGGEDRHEVAVCGVDPRTRGRRMDACIETVKALMTGEAVTHHGEFFTFDDAVVQPPPAVPIPILVGGRSEAALQRAGRYGEGWLGIWVSPERYSAATITAADAAERAGRDATSLRHGLTVWCGFGDDAAHGRAQVAPVMEGLYGLPFERFERYVPTGPPDVVAEALQPFVELGCASFSLLARGRSADATVEAAAEVRRLLQVGRRGGALSS
jgi:alkanesulfonate monooxygenase SsuD/methylene tetrahydromethanopterin reductase-like flavin-dependent oxidoreductase (luciferase family)